MIIDDSGQQLLYNSNSLQNLVKELNINHDNQAVEFPVLQKLKTLKFWCGDDQLHIREPKTYHERFCCMSHTVGLPRHSATNQEMAITPYQMECFEIISNHKKKKRGERKTDLNRKPHKFHINKGRQMGFTEIILRIMQYYAFTEYSEGKMGIIAGTKSALAKKNLIRFIQLFKNFPELILYQNSTEVKMANGITMESHTASQESMTGDTKYRAIFSDESAKWNAVDDLASYNSILPIVNTNASDFYMVSTPKGPTKTFHAISKDPKDFILMKFPIERTIGNLYTQEEVDEFLENSVEDPAQEYHCEFRFGRDALLGNVNQNLHIIDEVEWDHENEEWN